MAGPIRIAIIANGRQARAEASRTASSYSRMGSRVARAGRGLAGVFAVAQLARAAVAVGKVGASYVDSLNKIQALTGSTDNQMARLAKRVESQSSVFAKYGQTTGDAAAGMVELAKSGLSAQKSIGAIRGTMLLAKAGELEVADASTLVANTLNTFGLKAKAASKIANGLANAANISSADVSDLAESFKYAAPLAAKAGLSLSQTNAVLAELSNSGIKASQAGTTLRGMLIALQAPSTAGGMWLDDLGVKVYGAGGKMRDFGAILGDLRVSLAKVSDEDQNFALKSIFGRNAITGASVLIKGGTAALDEYTKGVNRAGAAQALAASASRGLAGTIASLKASATSTAQSFYRIYSPAIDSGLKKVIGFATKYKSILVPAIAGATVALTGFAVALGVIGIATSPVLLLGAAIGGLGAATVLAYQRSERFRAVVATTSDVIQTRLIPAARSFGDYLLNTTIPAIARTAQTVAQKLEPIATQLAATFRDDIRPALAQVDAKFREWQPSIKKAAETTGRLYARLIVLEATIAGKVIPIMIRFSAALQRTNIPITLKMADTFLRMASAGLQMAAMFVTAGRRASQFSSAVKSRVGQAIQVIASIPGRAAAALGNLGGTLLGAGWALIGGFVQGIKDRIGEVQSTLQGLTGKLTSWKGPPAKDRVLLRPAGRLVIDGFIRGIDDGIDGVRDVLGRVTDLVRTTFDKRFKKAKAAAAASKSTLKGLRDEYAQLVKNGKLQDKVNDSLGKARDRYRELVRTSRDYAASVKAGFQSYGSVVGLGTTGGGTAVTLPALLSQLAARAGIADQFSKVIERLKGKLNQTSLKQLLEQAAGGDLEGALATAQAIASGGAAAATQINQLTEQITKAGGKLGQDVAQKFYGSGIRMAEGIVKGLEKQKKRLDQVAVRLADQLVAQVRRQLNLSTTTQPNKTSSRVSALDTHTNRSPALDAYMRAGSSAAVQPTTVRIRFTADDINRLQRGREVVADVDLFFASGGRTKTKWGNR